MRRRGDTELVPNEVKLLLATISVTCHTETEVYGYALGKELSRLEGKGRLPMSPSTMYRALRRLEERGTLTSRWETAEELEMAGRDGPPRRYYTITPDGVTEAQAAVRRAEQARRRQPWASWIPEFRVS